MIKNENIRKLLSACSPNLESSEQCAYREGRIFRDGNYVLSRMERATSLQSNVEMSAAALLDFSFGLLGSTPSSRDTTNQCHEKCPFTKCEYHL